LSKNVKIIDKIFGNMEYSSYVSFVIRDKQLKHKNMSNLREFYLNNYPTDELGMEINENVTFAGLLNQLIIDGDVYKYIGVGDSIIRERLFEGLANELGTSYDYVYDLWMNENPIRKEIRKNVEFNLN
jgi:hypothetical protein